jgi:hypothetical protein
MSEKPKRLNEVLNTFAPEGANDRRWFLVEHQLQQAKMSLQTVLGSLRIISDKPENEQEREAAEDCMDIWRMFALDFTARHAAFLSYLSGTSVPERISRKEL